MNELEWLKGKSIWESMVINQNLERGYFEKGNFIYSWKRWKLFRS